MEAVTRIKRKSLRAHAKLDTTMCPDVKSQEACTVPVSVPPVNNYKTQMQMDSYVKEEMLRHIFV